MGFVNQGYCIVIPVHNGASLLPALIESLHDHSAPSAELILVDDGSMDGSWETICRYTGQNNSANLRVRGIRLDKNRGQQSAILAGITICRNRPLITMDDDGSHPPELIPRLLKALENGAELAYALPPARPGSILRRFFSRMHQMNMSLITGTPLSIRVGSYRGMSADLCRLILSQPFLYPYISAQALSLRPPPKVVMVDSPPFTQRAKTPARFSLRSLLKLEYRLAAVYGPLGKARRRRSSISKPATAGETAEGWIIEVTE